MTLIRPKFEVGDRVQFWPLIDTYPHLVFTYGEVTRLPLKETTQTVEVKMLKDGQTYCLMKDHLRNHQPKVAGPPYIKLLRQIRFESFGQDIICPPGRCLELVREDEHGVWVDVERDAGSFYIRNDDVRVDWATREDLINEPESNDYESHR